MPIGARFRCRYALMSANHAFNSRVRRSRSSTLVAPSILKEGLRYVFAVKGEEGKAALDRWAIWARRCRMPAFVQLQRRIAAHRPAIDAALDTGLSQGLVE